MPGQRRSLGSERGLATPSPDGKGEIALGPSMKIMPVDSYSTLGRSCEPAFKWILLGAGLRGGVRRSLSAGPRRAATRRAACLRPAVRARPRVHAARAIVPMQIPGASRRAKHVRPILDHASCDPPLRADRPRQRAFRDVPGGRFPCLGSILGAALRHRGRPPIPLIECCRIHLGRYLTGARMARRQKVTRSAAAEYPRAVHEPQSPGSAGVPPACGSRSVCRPSPSV